MLRRALIKRAKGQTISKANYGVLISSKKRTKLIILTREDAQDSEFRSFFGRIEETIYCFRDLLTFRQNPLTNTQLVLNLVLIKTAGPVFNFD